MSSRSAVTSLHSVVCHEAESLLEAHIASVYEMHATMMAFSIIHCSAALRFSVITGVLCRCYGS